MSKPVMTLHECADLLRAHGFRCSPKSLRNGIVSGEYPFGRIKSVGATGRVSTEIFRVYVDAWIREMTPGG